MKQGAKTTVALQVEDINDILEDPKILETMPLSMVNVLRKAKEIADKFIELAKEPNPNLRDQNITRYKTEHRQAIADEFTLISTYIYNTTQKDLKPVQQNGSNLLAIYSNLNIIHSFLKYFIPLTSQEEHAYKTRTFYLSLLFTHTARANTWITAEFLQGRLTKSDYRTWYQTIAEKIEWLEVYGSEYQEFLLGKLNEDGSEKSPSWDNMQRLLDFYKCSILFCSSLKLDEQAARLYSFATSLCARLTKICSQREHAQSASLNTIITSFNPPPLIHNDLILAFFRQMDNFLNNSERNAIRFYESDQSDQPTLQEQCKETALSLSRLTCQSSRAEAISLFHKILQHLISYHAIPNNQRQEETIKGILKEWLHASIILKIPELVDKDFICDILEIMFQKVIDNIKKDLLLHTKAAKRKAELDALEEQFKAMVIDPLEKDETQEILHQEKITRLKLEHQQAMQSQREMLVEQSKKRQAERTAEHEKELADLNAKNTKALLKEKGSLLSKREEQLLKLDKRFSRHVHQLEQAHIAEIAKVHDEYNSEMQRLEAEHQAKLAAIELENESKRKALEQEKQAQLQAYRKLVQKQRQQKEQESQKKLQEYSAALEEESSRTLVELDEQLQAKLEQLRLQHAKATQELEEQSRQREYTKSTQKRERHRQAQNVEKASHQGKIIILKRKLGWQTEFTNLKAFAQIVFSNEIKFILSSLEDKECYITGDSVLNRLLGRVQQNEIIEVVVNCDVRELNEKLRGHGSNIEGYPQIVRLGNIVFHCLQGPTLKEALANRPFSASFVCHPATGEVYDVVKTKEALCSLSQLYITEYTAKLSQLFFTQNGFDNFCLINRMGILRQLCPFLPDNYSEILNNPQNGLYHFWSKTIFEFSMHPEKYSPYHVLSLFFIMPLIMKPDQLSDEICLSRNIDKLFLLCPTNAREEDKSLVRNNLKRIILGGIEEANPLGGLFVQYNQSLRAMHAPAPLYTPGYDMLIQGMTLASNLEETNQDDAKLRKKK